MSGAMHRNTFQKPVRIPAAALVVLGLIGGTAGCCGNQSPPAAPLPQGELAVRLMVIQGVNGTTMALVPVFINGEGPFAFALDTGASNSVLDLEVARQLRLKPVGHPIKVSGVGSVADAQPIYVRSWRVGDVELPSWKLVTIAMPHTNREIKLAGLLGSDVLSRFGAVRVDYAGQYLVLNEPRLPPPAEAPADQQATDERAEME